MACRGVLFSLSEDEVRKLKSFQTDRQRLDFIQEEIEAYYFESDPARKAETDKAWDAIHRCLTDGALSYENGSYPLNHVILGGNRLYFQDDYIMVLKTPAQVRDIAAGLDAVSEEGMRDGYGRIDPGDYGVDLTDEDFDGTYGWFLELMPFFRKAAEENRYVLFTVDQ